MYVLYKSKNILTLITIGYIVGFMSACILSTVMGPSGHIGYILHILDCLGQVYAGDLFG